MTSIHGVFNAQPHCAHMTATWFHGKKAKVAFEVFLKQRKLSSLCCDAH